MASRNGRVLRSASVREAGRPRREHWRAVIEECRRSGLSQAEFCRRRHIPADAVLEVSLGPRGPEPAGGPIPAGVAGLPPGAAHRLTVAARWGARAASTPGLSRRLRAAALLILKAPPGPFTPLPGRRTCTSPDAYRNRRARGSSVWAMPRCWQVPSELHTFRDTVVLGEDRNRHRAKYTQRTLNEYTRPVRTCH